MTLDGELAVIAHPPPSLIYAKASKMQIHVGYLVSLYPFTNPLDHKLFSCYHKPEKNPCGIIQVILSLFECDFPLPQVHRRELRKREMALGTWILKPPSEKALDIFDQNTRPDKD